ncbi:flagellar basal body-associated FliL family protein [Candidatus Fukatsuia endosymbiont of Tuberolachnus salignus]|uniref:flagellar basal body-associated FliL family protein n=1 Tax=Candidatus Fukatsuia endosymbiont of Tuberolachnus salignus TaxID=3077957 RepID=UPI00313C1C55
MTILKKFSKILIVIAIAATLIGGWVAFNYQNEIKKDPIKPPTWCAKNFVRGNKAVQFVEIKNMVITLKNIDQDERYMLLELGIATGDDDDIKKVNALTPAIRGATVNLLSGMNYREVRDLTIADLRQSLMSEYQKNFNQLKVPMPFDDVVISKMVFQ